MDSQSKPLIDVLDAFRPDDIVGGISYNVLPPCLPHDPSVLSRVYASQVLQVYHQLTQMSGRENANLLVDLCRSLKDEMEDVTAYRMFMGAIQSFHAVIGRRQKLINSLVTATIWLYAIFNITVPDDYRWIQGRQPKLPWPRQYRQEKDLELFVRMVDMIPVSTSEVKVLRYRSCMVYICLWMDEHSYEEFAKVCKILPFHHEGNMTYSRFETGLSSFRDIFDKTGQYISLRSTPTKKPQQLQRDSEVSKVVPMITTISRTSVLRCES